MAGNYTHFNGLLPGAFVIQRFTVDESTTSGQIVSVQNPEGAGGVGGVMPVGNVPAGTNVFGPSAAGIDLDYDAVGDVIVREAVLRIISPSDAACTLNVGIGSADDGNYDNLIDGISVATAPLNTLYDNITDGGSNGLPEGVVMTYADYCNVTVASGNANGLQAELLLIALQPTGGP